MLDEYVEIGTEEVLGRETGTVFNANCSRHQQQEHHLSDCGEEVRCVCRYHDRPSFSLVVDLMMLPTEDIRAKRPGNYYIIAHRGETEKNNCKSTYCECVL